MRSSLGGVDVEEVVEVCRTRLGGQLVVEEGGVGV